MALLISTRIFPGRSLVPLDVTNHAGSAVETANREASQELIEYADLTRDGRASRRERPRHRRRARPSGPWNLDDLRETSMSVQTPAAGSVGDPRVYLAAERTFLAWVRTSLALMGFGFLIARFGLLIRESELLNVPGANHRRTLSPWLGFSMICFGVVVCVLSSMRHRSYIQALEAGVVNPPLGSRAPLIVAGILTLVGLSMALHILTL